MEFLSEDPGQDKAADTEFFRETFQGQFFGIVGIQIEKQSLLQFQVICVFTHLQRQRWQQVCQQDAIGHQRAGTGTESAEGHR